MKVFRKKTIEGKELEKQKPLQHLEQKDLNVQKMEKPQGTKRQPGLCVGFIQLFNDTHGIIC